MSKRIKTGESQRPDHKICDLYTFSYSLLEGQIRQQTSRFLESILSNTSLSGSQLAEKKLTEALKKLGEDKFNNVYDVLDFIHEAVFKHKQNEQAFFEKIEKTFLPRFCSKTIDIERQSQQFDGWDKQTSWNWAD